MEEKKNSISKWIIVVAIAAVVAVVIPLLAIFTDAFKPNLTSVEMIAESEDYIYTLVDGKCILDSYGKTKTSLGEKPQLYATIKNYSQYKRFLKMLEKLPEGIHTDGIKEHFLESEEYDKAFFRKYDLILVEQQVYELTDLEEIYRDGNTLHITFSHHNRETKRSQLFIIPISDNVSKKVKNIEVDYFEW